MFFLYIQTLRGFFRLLPLNNYYEKHFLVFFFFCFFTWLSLFLTRFFCLQKIKTNKRFLMVRHQILLESCKEKKNSKKTETINGFCLECRQNQLCFFFFHPLLMAYRWRLLIGTDVKLKKKHFAAKRNNS